MTSSKILPVPGPCHLSDATLRRCFAERPTYFLVVVRDRLLRHCGEFCEVDFTDDNLRFIQQMTLESLRDWADPSPGFIEHALAFLAICEDAVPEPFLEVVASLLHHEEPDVRMQMYLLLRSGRVPVDACPVATCLEREIQLARAENADTRPLEVLLEVLLFPECADLRLVARSAYCEFRREREAVEREWLTRVTMERAVLLAQRRAALNLLCVRFEELLGGSAGAP